MSESLPHSRRPLVAVYVASRADLAPLLPVIEQLRDDLELDLLVLASGTLGNSKFGDPLADLNVPAHQVIHVASQLKGSDYQSQTGGGTAISEAVSEVLRQRAFSAFVVLGDRWELMYAIPPVILAGVPIVHLHGGEITEGAIDDRIRHSTSKLADLHCVSTEAAAGRLRQMGEPPRRIHVTGAPSLDRIATVRPASTEELDQLLGQALRRPLALVTYHPVTVGGPDPGLGARQLLDVVADAAGSVLVTHPGLDRGRDAVIAEIDAVVAERPHVVAVRALGERYLPVLAAADFLVGNSSSGIIEASSFAVPVVDVGERQRGRPRDRNVVHADETVESIRDAVRSALAPGFRDSLAGVTNQWGDGASASRVVDVVRIAVKGGLARKEFVAMNDDRHTEGC